MNQSEDREPCPVAATFLQGIVEGAMPSRRRPLVSGEYVNSGEAVNDQTTSARQKLVRVIQCIVPEFFEQLRERVYPKYAVYARLAARTASITPKGSRRGPGDWELGLSFESWDDPASPNRLKPLLMSWAKTFGSADEPWVLKGALETLSAWYQFPAWRQSLDVSRFCLPVAQETLVNYEKFTLAEAAWGPQWETWSIYSARVKARFKDELQAYEMRVRTLIESRGGQRARRRYSVNNLEWFVFYQICGMSSVQIENARGGAKGDESTVLKGIKTAAELLSWNHLRSTPALKSQE
jgi:hypothetical protein